MVPDELYPFLVEVGTHEVAGADGGVAVSELRVRSAHHVAHPCQLRLVPGQPPLEEPVNGRLVGEEGYEVEAPPERAVDDGYRAVGGVHGADDPQVLR